MPRTEWHKPLVVRLIADNGGESPKVIVERYADRIRRDAQQDRLPVKPALIASLLGIKQRRAAYDSAGRIDAEPSGQLVMDINADDSQERQHFTEAHELMHPVFADFIQQERYRLDASMDRHATNQEEEYLCDLGAAALLMPAELICDKYTVRGGLADVQRLSLDAEVSIEAAANRIVSTADEPAVLLCLRLVNKPADRDAQRKGAVVPPQWRVSYAVTRHLAVYVPKFKGVSAHSALALAGDTDGTESGIERLPGASGAGMFRVEAQRYGSGPVARVLAIARPTA